MTWFKSTLPSIAIISASLFGTMGLPSGSPTVVQAATTRAITTSLSPLTLTAWPARLRPVLAAIEAGKPSAPLEGPTWLPTYPTPVSAKMRDNSVGEILGSHYYTYALYETSKALPVNSSKIDRNERDATPLLVVQVASPWRRTTASEIDIMNPNWSQPIGPSAAVSLGHGIVGLRYMRERTGYLVNSPYEDRPAYVWHEGDWTLEVSGQVGISATKIEHEAKAVVTLLNRYLLPPHLGTGVVTITPKGTLTAFAWQQNKTGVILNTYQAMPGNAGRTIRMAASWHVTS